MRACLFLISLVVLSDGAETTQQQTRPTSKPTINQTMLRGIWWSSEWEPSAAFRVDDSTFYYPEYFVHRKYRIKGDSLFVLFDDGSVLPSVVVKLTADTLIMFSYGKNWLYTRTEPHR